MLTVEYCQLMTRYNKWQNHSFGDAASSLKGRDLEPDQNAVASSITKILSHLLWDDALWLARFSGNEKPEDHIPFKLYSFDEFEIYRSEREERDDKLIKWAKNLVPLELEGYLRWFPGGGGSPISKPKKLCVIHLFNHQAHHRGQIHTMLKAEGIKPPATDLPMLPG